MREYVDPSTVAWILSAAILLGVIAAIAVALFHPGSKGPGSRNRLLDLVSRWRPLSAYQTSLQQSAAHRMTQMEWRISRLEDAFQSMERDLFDLSLGPPRASVPPSVPVYAPVNPQPAPVSSSVLHESTQESSLEDPRRDRMIQLLEEINETWHTGSSRENRAKLQEVIEFFHEEAPHGIDLSHASS